MFVLSKGNNHEKTNNPAHNNALSRLGKRPGKNQRDGKR